LSRFSLQSLSDVRSTSGLRASASTSAARLPTQPSSTRATAPSASEKHCTPQDLVAGIVTPIAVADAAPASAEFIIHGSTLPINAILERKGHAPRSHRLTRMRCAPRAS
jgi:hypothetical protein